MSRNNKGGLVIGAGFKKLTAPLFLLKICAILEIEYPKKMQILKLILKIIFRILLYVLVLALMVMAVVNWPVKDKNDQMDFGISFSNVFARDIGLDWKKAYVDILDGLQPKKVRLAAYWTEIEKQPGQYNFSDLDYQIQEASKRNIEITLAFGIKVPRWPECFIPDFYGGNPTLEENPQTVWKKDPASVKSEREEALLLYEKEIVNRYKDNENIKIWQVENEPFLPFGNCVAGAVDAQIIDREISQVKKLDDSRPIMVTDSGELSLWYKAASRADIFGTTLYRTIYKLPMGYVTYPISPMFFRIKALPVRYFTKAQDIVIAELQGEPWGPAWLTDMNVQEQYRSMNPEKFEQTMDYARKTKFSTSYIWGVEWWYWLKEDKKDARMWEEAKKVIHSQRD